MDEERELKKNGEIKWKTKQILRSPRNVKN